MVCGAVGPMYYESHVSHPHCSMSGVGGSFNFNHQPPYLSQSMASSMQSWPRCTKHLPLNPDLLTNIGSGAQLWQPFQCQ